MKLSITRCAGSIGVLLASQCLFNAACQRSGEQPPAEKQRTSAVAQFPERTGRVSRLAPLALDRDNFDWHDVASDGMSTIYVSDNSQWCVHVLAAESGRPLARFGRKGQGPGEFMYIARVRFVEALGVGVLDNMLRRITWFDPKGNVKLTLGLDRMSDDFCKLREDTIVVSSYSLERGYKPLRTVSMSTGKVGHEFGTTVEPLEGIRDKIAQSPTAGGDVHLYSFGGMTRVVFAPETGTLVFSQRHPYYLLMFNDGLAGQRIDVSLPFSTADSMEYKVKSGKRTATIHPSGVVLEPLYAQAQRAIWVASFNATAQQNILDIYNLQGQLRMRLELPSLDRGVKPLSATLLRDSVLALLVRGNNGKCWIERFSVKF